MGISGERSDKRVAFSTAYAHGAAGIVQAPCLLQNQLWPTAIAVPVVNGAKWVQTVENVFLFSMACTHAA